MSRRAARLVVPVLVAMVAAGCTSGDHPTAPPGLPRGGTLRVGLLSGDGSVSGWCPLLICGRTFDPQSTSFVDVFELDRCCFMRTLLTYKGASVGQGGTELRPDLARSLPTISPDGLTWTFHLRTGIHYAPPMANREIVAGDLIRSLERTFTRASSAIPWSNGGTIGGYWTDTYLADAIAGAHEFTDGKADHVSGLQAPDPHTLVVHLTQPTGDLGYRLALPQLGPIPANPSHPSDPLGVAQGHDFDYGDVMVASGPYMFEGADKLSYALPPEDQLPPRGDGVDMAVLVRNPSWSPANDPVRTAWADRIEFVAVDSPKQAERMIEDGRLDVVLNSGANSATTNRWLADPAERARTTVGTLDGEHFLFMNLAVPPFDDVHVRRAINLAVDRQAVAAAYTGTGDSAQRVFNHLALDSYEDDLLLSYAPPGVTSTGDVDAARQEMSRSRYDRDHDGRCDAPACSGLALVVRASQGPATRAGGVVAGELRGIGLGVHLDRQDDQTYFDSMDPGSHTALRMDSWIKDFPSASTFFPVLLKGDAIGSTNLSMLGATPAQLRRYGYSVRSVPSADGRIESCEELVFDAQTRCWAQLDQYLIEQVVPWVPLTEELTGWLSSARVRRFSLDASVGIPLPALDSIRIDRSAPKPVAAPSATPIPEIPDGVYRVTVTLHDIASFGGPKDDDEDAGTFTIVLNAGRFLWHQRGSAPIFNPIALGTYGGSGDTVTFDQTQPYYAAGALSPLTWRLVGSALEFGLSRCTGPAATDSGFCAVQKALFTAHPWERVDRISGGPF